MRVLKISAGLPPQKITIPHTVSAMQAVIGGAYEIIYPFYNENIAFICNERGYVDGHVPNRRLHDPVSGELLTVIYGTFVICAIKGENLVSLSRRQFQRFYQLFKTPDSFDTPYQYAPIRLYLFPSCSEITEFMDILNTEDSTTNSEDKLLPF